MIRILGLVSCVVVAVAAAAVPAAARPTRVALTKITGDTTGLGKIVIGALDGSELEIVAGTPVSRALERLGLEEAVADRDVARLAAELEVEAVVTGAFDRRGHRLRFTIITAKSKTKPFTLQVGNARSEKFKKLVRKTLIAKVTAAVPKVSDDEPVADDKPAKAEADGVVADDKPARHKTRLDEAAADEPPAKRKAKADQTAAAPAEDAPKPRQVAAVDADADDAPRPKPRRVAARDDDDASAVAVEARGESRSPAGHSTNLAALRVDLGASMAGRSLRFDVAPFPGAPARYRQAAAPGARFAVELYPLAFRDPSSLLAGIGVAAEYDQAVSMTLRASDEMTVPLKTTDRHYSVGARFRLAFGHRPTSPTLTIGIGYAARTFMVDRSQLMSANSLDLPDVDYRMYDPGLAFRLPLGTRVAVTLAGQFLMVNAAGPIQHNDQYGAARVLGGNASAGVEAMINDRIAVRLAAEATQLDFAFHGTGTLSTNRDGDSSTLDVHGATDRYYGGVATIAVTY